MESKKGLTRPKLIFAILAIVTSTLFLFQNCGDPYAGGRSAQSSFLAGLGFAYENKMDHIAYMSCSGLQEDFDPSAYYTFRVGAYNNGSGIRLSSQFRDALVNYTDDEKASSLSLSTQNAGLALQLSVRQASDYQSVVTGSNGSFIENEDFDDFLDATLDSQKIAEALVLLEPSDYVNYFSGVSGLTGRLMEASVRYMDSEIQAQSVRSRLRDDGLLTLTFARRGTSDMVAAVGPEGLSSSKVYGTGYELSYGIGQGMGLGNGTFYNFTSADRRVLRTVSEINMESGARGTGAWNCDAGYSFMIVRPEDNATVNCSTAAEDPNNPHPAYQAIRKVLPMSHWHVDLTNRCVVPKSNTDKCYGTDFDSNSFTIDYNGGECNVDNSGLLCPHYVSVCVRND